VRQEAYVYNLFNIQIETSRDQQWTVSPSAGFPANIYDPNQSQNNPDYGKATSRSAPRSFRAALRLSFGRRAPVTRSSNSGAAEKRRGDAARDHWRADLRRRQTPQLR
jgi:hypothetical protein